MDRKIGFFIVDRDFLMTFDFYLALNISIVKFGFILSPIHS